MIVLTKKEQRRLFLMEAIITQTLEKLKGNFVNFFNGDYKNIEEAENYLVKSISEASTSILSAYYEQIDAQIREDKKGRKEKNLVIERRHDKREVQTILGPVSVNRTYYKQCVGYTYPIDSIMGIDAYQRISNGTTTELINTAVSESFERTSLIVTNGAISKQTVMNKIRKAEPDNRWSYGQKEVPVLHIDADEDHIHLQNGKSAIVPMATIYEKVDKNSKRHYCINKFQVSEYGLSPDKFWEQVYQKVCERYDIADTTIYLHGDGAAWIKKGLDWFEGAIFVLDPFHKNKAIKQSTANMKRVDCVRYQKKVAHCLEECDEGDFQEIQAEMCEKYPHLTDNILRYTGYLYDNIDGIMIRYQDDEARNGGATEPHISHGLSSRLSNRPRGWSKKTLEHFVPILAAKRGIIVSPIISKNAPASKAHKRVPNSAGLVDPDTAVSLSASIAGKQGSLYQMFKSIWG